MTDWLFAADRTDHPVTLAGPFGAFYRRPGTGRMICVAGGSGLAPIHAMIEEALGAGVVRECVVLFGARAQRDLYDLDELHAFGARWSGGFRVIPVLSAEPTDSPWQGRRGFVTDALDAVAAERPLGAGDEAYLCGPPPMVDAGVEKLVTLGLPDGAIFFDKFLDASTQPGGRAAM